MANFGVAVAGGGGKRRDDDFYPTPPEPTRALLHYYNDIIPQHVYEPACGEGHMARVLVENGYTVLASDLVHRGYGFGAIDFVSFPADRLERGAWAVITNPPFIYADEFITKAHELEAPFIAMFLKQTYWNAAKRYDLWKKHPPKACHPITFRVDFTGGGNATMDCMWVVYGRNVPFSNEPLRRV
jgi:hypothetical protein